MKWWTLNQGQKLIQRGVAYLIALCQELFLIRWGWLNPNTVVLLF